MLERIAAGPPAHWRHAERWSDRMRAWARQCARLVVAPAGVERAVEVLGVPRERVVGIANGVDVELFAPCAINRQSFWRRALVEQPQGWFPGQPPGSARYGERATAKLASGIVLLYAGRFTAIKRLDRLIAAFGRAQERFTGPVGLVLVGGHPGEWEAEHPANVAARLGVADVFLAGWQAQEQLPAFFRAADAVVLTSEREQFGQVLIEGMACGLPAIATRSLGPAAIIEDGRSGWLVEPDDDAGLAAALAEAVNDSRERARRGHAAHVAVRERFSWTGIASQLACVLDEVVGEAVEPAVPRLANA
jgi:glycosyltransferase involved in cell wall biosynthesis